MGGGASGPSEACFCRVLMGEVKLSGSVSVPEPSSEPEASSSHESATAALAGFLDGLVPGPGAGECDGEWPVEVEILRPFREASSSVKEKAGWVSECCWFSARPLSGSEAHQLKGWRTTYRGLEKEVRKLWGVLGGLRKLHRESAREGGAKRASSWRRS